MKCRQCTCRIVGRGLSNGVFCSARCKWTWHNQNRRLKPNAHYVCEICGVKVHRYISPSRQSVDPMRYCSRTCKGRAQCGENHPRWTGGKHRDKQGYIYVYAKEHPSANSHGMVFEHRIVMESMIGRYLTSKEVVHHINGVPSDNRPDNLMLFADNAKHKKHHNKLEIKRDKKGRYSRCK